MKYCSYPSFVTGVSIKHILHKKRRMEVDRGALLIYSESPYKRQTPMAPKDLTGLLLHVPFEIFSNL